MSKKIKKWSDLDLARNRYNINILLCSNLTLDEKTYCENCFTDSSKCILCLKELMPDDLVQRFEIGIFHNSCIVCSICNLPIDKGDKFKFTDGNILCKIHLFENGKFRDQDLKI